MTASRSASSKTTTGALPPSSRWSRLTRSAAVRAMCLPVSVSPVTEIIPTFGWATSASPIAAPVPVITLSTPGGQDVGGDLGQDEGRQRRPRRRLEDDRVAGHQGRADLPAGHHDRVVPRRDRGDDPDRLAPDEARVAGHVLVGRLALHDPARAGEEAQVVDDDRDLVDGRADRLAGVLATRAGRSRRPGPRCASASLSMSRLRSCGVVCCQVSKAAAAAVGRPVDVLGRSRPGRGR